MHLVQGASTNGALRLMPEAIFAAERGKNAKETIELLADVLGTSLIVTYRTNHWYPFVCGDGPISRWHEGMVVPGRGRVLCTQLA